MKAIVCCKVLLLYPDFNKPFHIHTDASHYQLGTVISQDKKHFTVVNCNWLRLDILQQKENFF
jgi:hypothetical protein